MMYAGIDIGGTKCASVLGKLSDGGMAIRSKRCFQTNGQEPFDVLERLADDLKRQIADAGCGTSDLAGIGISAGGPLNSSKGVLLSPPNLPKWDRIQVTDFFEKAFGVPAYLQNDANACAVAEWKYGAGKGFQNIVFLTFGTGLGAGMILNGRLYTGTNDMAGEIGHVRLTEDGPVGYGKTGSMEGYCSGGGIMQLGRSYVERQLDKGETPRLLTAAGSLDGINAKLISELADDGDALCMEVYRESGDKLGMGLSILIDVLNPEVIIIGSIFTRSHHLLWDSASRVIKRETLQLNNMVCRVEKSLLGELVGDMAALSVATGEY